jgi:hypothetical protein
MGFYVIGREVPYLVGEDELLSEMEAGVLLVDKPLDAGVKVKPLPAPRKYADYPAKGNSQKP